MYRVKLEVLGNGPYIKAPSHCKYSIIGSDSRLGLSSTVHSTVCNLCKLCNFFISDFENVNVSQEERDKIQSYLVSYPEVSSSLLRQQRFLLQKNRLPLLVLLSGDCCEKVFQNIFDKERAFRLLSYYSLHESPICYVIGCPVYYSRKLTKSSIQVVGEAEWK